MHCYIVYVSQHTQLIYMSMPNYNVTMVTLLVAALFTVLQGKGFKL